MVRPQLHVTAIAESPGSCDKFERFLQEFEATRKFESRFAMGLVTYEKFRSDIWKENSLVMLKL